jgi:translation initiation factor 2D
MPHPVEEKQEEVDPRSPQEIMDERLERSFLQAWKTSAKRPELPMLCSNFYRLHMVPQAREPLDVKKSSFKKLSKFLAQMQKEGVVKVQELQVILLKLYLSLL